MLAKTKMLGLMLAAAMVSTSPMLVYADNGGGDKDWHQGGGWHHGQQDHMFAKILNLSNDQVKQLKDAKEKQKTAMKGIFEQMKSNREALEAEITKASPDMNKVNDIQTQIKTLLSQMVDNHLSSMMDIKKIMTPEQFAGYMALKKERMLMMHKMMGHGKFGHKDGFGKDGDHKHWGDKDGADGHDSDD